MIIKGVIDEDFINYKKPSMVIQFPKCTFKCEKECGQQVCQNSTLATAPNIEIEVDKLIERYLKNHITRAIVFAGLEPFDSLEDVFDFVYLLRTKYHCDDTVVVYTGYTEEECEKYRPVFSLCRNIVVKYGRYIPNQKPHYDELLGVYLASDNQYAKGYGLGLNV